MLLLHFVGSKSKDGDVIVPPVSRNGHVLSGDESVVVNIDPTDDASPSSLPPSELSPPPLPPKEPVSSSSTASVHPLPAQKSDFLLRKDGSEVPIELPPKLPPKKPINVASRVVKASNKNNPYDVPTRSKYGVSPVKETQQSNIKEQQPPLLPLQSIPPQKAVVASSLQPKLNTAGNNYFMATLPEDQTPTPSPPPSPLHSNDSDVESDHDETFIREAAVITDKYVSIHNDHKLGSIDIFVSKPHCVVESSESSDEEGGCNGGGRALSPNTNPVSPDYRISEKELVFLPVKLPAKHEDGLNMSTTAQESVQALPPPEIKHSKVISPPLSAPPVGTMSPLPSLSAVSCTSSDAMPLLSSNSIVGVYSQLRLPPEEPKEQVIMIFCLWL